jgi:hypoxanthine phosphoribosyltransferase
MKSPKRPEKYEVPSWNNIYDMCLKVAGQIMSSDYKPDLIVAISRGGWIPGRVLSDLLGNPKIATIKVEYYEDIYKTRSKPEITQPLTVDVSGKRVLLVDDIADSGHSLKLVKEHLFEKGAADVKICTLYHKPWSVVVPDFNARTTDAWVCFPHEIFETMRKVSSKLKTQGKTTKEVEQKLLRMGIKSNLVRKFLSQKPQS